MNRYITALGLLTVATLLSTSCTKQDPSKDALKDLSHTDYVVYMSDLEAATTNKMDKVTDAMAEHIATFDETGNVVDPGIPWQAFAPVQHIHRSITTDEPGMVGGSGATLAVNDSGVVSVSWHPGSAYPDPVEGPWTKTVAFIDDVKALLVALVGGTIFEADHPYVVGDVVLCNDTLLKCTNACQEAEPTAGNWIRAKLSVQ